MSVKSLLAESRYLCSAMLILAWSALKSSSDALRDLRWNSNLRDGFTQHLR
jgi:hypothetical protein